MRSRGEVPGLQRLRPARTQDGDDGGGGERRGAQRALPADVLQREQRARKPLRHTNRYLIVLTRPCIIASYWLMACSLAITRYSCFSGRRGRDGRHESRAPGREYGR